MPASVQIRGARELRRAMKAAGEDMGKLTDVHRDVGKVVLRAGKRDSPYRTGALRASLRSAPTRTKARVASRLPYAAPIHWGVPSRGIEPSPWLSDAAVRTESDWEQLYRDKIDSLIDDIGRST